ncbi:MAG TPA: mechanosensitive ion channel family protein [Dongiaceae bacterium]
MPDLSMEHLSALFTDSMVSLGIAVIHIVGIVLAGIIAVRFLKNGIQRFDEFLINASQAEEPFPGATRRRVATLSGLIETIALALVWAIVVIISLEQLGLDIRPILAGAGLIGLAVGFGAQNLVRDLISGFFMILEDQVRVGDVAVVNGTGGLVESISFRTITLRDEAGAVHVFENGMITTLANMTKDWSAYVIEIGVAYKEDTDRVIEVMRRVAEELRQDRDYADKFMGPIEIFGVDQFGDSAVMIKGRLKTRPIEQWNVGREYRRRLKKAFDAEGIEIPFPHRAVLLTSNEPGTKQAAAKP